MRQPLSGPRAKDLRAMWASGNIRFRFLEPLPRGDRLAVSCLNAEVPVCVRELCMPRSWTPSIVPIGDNQIVYLVLDDFGRLGRAYRETDEERIDRKVSSLIC